MLSSLSPKCINLVKKAQQDNSHLTGAIIEHGGCEGNSLYLYTAIRCQEKWQEKITLYRRNINLDMMNLRKYCSRSLGDLGVDLSYIPQHFTVSERQEKQIYKDAQMQKIRDEGHKDLMKDLENLKPEKNYYQ